MHSMKAFEGWRCRLNMPTPPEQLTSTIASSVFDWHITTLKLEVVVDANARDYMSAESYVAVVARNLPRGYWHFSKFNMAAAFVLDFHDNWIWHVLRWWLSASWALTKFGSNISCNGWERPTYFCIQPMCL